MMDVLKDNVSKYSVGALVLVVLGVLLSSGLFVQKSDAYREFVTQDNFQSRMDETNRKLDYIIHRIDGMAGN